MIFPAQIARRTGAVALSVIICLICARSRAQNLTDSALEPISPAIESLERPSGTYQAGEMIRYRIKVSYPSSVKEIRMSPPDLSLENLDLIAVNQETISGSGESGPAVQLLTFNFKAPNPGHAKIKRFSLKWTRGDGTSTHELSVPPLELNITPSPNQWLFAALASLTVGVGSVSILFWLFKIRKKPIQPNNAVQSLESLFLGQFLNAREKWQADLRHEEFLSELSRLFERYTAQKLDWNPSGDDYNALQKKAEQKWTKKDALELIELFRTLEYERFSGSQRVPDHLEKLYQNLCHFIERKIII